MKKIYTSIGVVIFAVSTVFGQQNIRAHYSSKSNSSLVNLSKAKENPTQLANPLAAIWSDDFSNPNTWTISHASGTTGDWVIGTSGPAGTYAIPAITSTSAANGFALFDSDLICSGNEVADLTTANSIDCSGHSGVLLKFQQTYKRFDDSTFVFISTNGTTWTKFPVNALVSNNNDVVNPETISINISSVAGNQATVWIRFEFWSPSTYTTGPAGAPGCGYSWMVDDVTLVDAPTNDLVALTAIGYEHSKVPAFQGESSNFGLVVSNSGAAAQPNTKLNIKIKKGITSVFEQDGNVVSSFPSSYSDTLIEDVPYLANAAGDYSVIYNVTSDNTDEVPGDNSITQTFSVSDSVFARDGGFNSSINGTSNGVETGTTNSKSYKIGNRYNIKGLDGSVEATSITFAVVNNTAGLANTIGETVKVTLGVWDTTNTTALTVNEVATSIDYTLTANDVTDISTATSLKYITLPFTSSYNIVDGDYFACVEYLGNSGGKIVYVGTSAPNLYKFPGTSYIYDEFDAQGPGWFYYPTTTPVVRLNVHGPANGIKGLDNNLSQSLTCYPNPTSGLTTISFETKETTDISIKVVDVTGKTVSSINQGRKAAGKQIANVDLSSLPAGIYAYIVTAGSYTATKTVLIK